MFLIVCVIVFLAVYVVCGSVASRIYPHKYQEYVTKYAAEYSVDETLLYSVIKTESDFEPDAVSSAGARGLTQITQDTFDWLLTKTHEEYTFDDLFTPEVSVKYGALFLSILLDEYGETETAVAAYHAGMGNVSGWLGDKQYSSDGVHLDEIPISDTAHYVNKVMKCIDRYNKIYQEEK